MTTQNYTHMTNQELVDEILSYKTNYSNLNKFIKNKNFQLYCEVVHRTKFLDDCFGKLVPIKSRIYCLQNNLTSVPICNNPNCTNFVKWDKDGFRSHCSNYCSQHDELVINKRKETSIQRYGYESPSQSPIVKQKCLETFMSKYGCSCSLQNPDVKKKCEQTCIERYGTDNPMESPIVQERYKQTCKERYGVEWASQLDCVKQKAKEACENKYGGVGFASKEIYDKVKQTNMQNLGVEYASQSEEVQQKVRETCQQKFGVDCAFQSEEVKDKIKQTCIERYGVEHISQVKSIMEKRDQHMIELYGGVGYASTEIKDKCETTCVNLFGVKNFTQSDEYKEMHDAIQSKRECTCNERYGVPHYAKTEQFNSLIHKPYTNPKYPEMTFGSSWEFKVYDFLKEHGIEFEYQPSISFEYKYDGKVHTYHPDFKVGDKIFEVKGDQFFNESGQMINPYDRTEDGKYESKRQCMLNNNVVILRLDDIKQLDLKMFS